jgi:hypothetical protein
MQWILYTDTSTTTTPSLKGENPKINKGCVCVCVCVCDSLLALPFYIKKGILRQKKKKKKKNLWKLKNISPMQKTNNLPKKTSSKTKKPKSFQDIIIITL